MVVARQVIIEQIESMLAGLISREDLGWWAYDLLLEDSLVYEPLYEKLSQDVLRSIYYFHDTETFMQQFYPDLDEIVYYLKCLKGEEYYQRFRVVHWRV